VKWLAQKRSVLSAAGLPAGAYHGGATAIGPWIATLIVSTVMAIPGCVSHDARDLSILYPCGLSPGDTIAFVAPAGKLDRARMALARERLIAMGFRVQVPENLYRARGYLAGTDAERAAELMAAFRDPDVNAIFPGTGNYGCTRMIDRLDYAEIRIILRSSSASAT
jgi:muramoyltetrapeptide carboxypeptidase